ncbi:Transposable element P transposase [Oopsacas minuta]|uniref:Transposable element P transposase n=1 Tax=Oopsacas minuta TaxID=111878 RepID=A0AAV7JIX9_9METZ|nr:Transposable element P transposase [Oopsacas minuta]
MPKIPPELKQAWIRALHREDIDRLKVVYECIKHFREEDVDYFHKVPNGDGTFTSVPRDKLKLKEGAIPSLLPSFPSYYSSTSTSKRTRLFYKSKEKEMLNQTIQLSLKSESEAKHKFIIRNLQDLKAKLNYIVLPDNCMLCISPGFKVSFSTYLSQATSSFSSLERNVIVQMDEIHIKSDITYKGGKIFAPNLDPEDPTRTVFAVMISSLHEKWSCISRLLPCGSISAKRHFPSSKSVSLILRIVVYVYRIRNNWLNQKNFDKTMYYLKLEDFEIDKCQYPLCLHSASFQDVSLLYSSERGSLAKLAPQLTVKACFPSSIERQDVELVLKVFNGLTLSALEIPYEKRCEEYRNNTSTFVRILPTLWKIFNVSTPSKGIR